MLCVQFSFWNITKAFIPLYLTDYYPITMASTRSNATSTVGDHASNITPLEEVKQAPKRKRDVSTSQTQQQRPSKRRKSSPGPVKNGEEEQRVEEPKPLPRLTTPDLEFDFDRSKLKDPRPTPGREARPRYDEGDIPEELAARRPPSPAKPKGRLTNAKKDALLRQQIRLDPAMSSQYMYRCFDKGPNGSPTYDNAGFQVDYQKVADSLNPAGCTKRAAVQGMNMAVAGMQSLEEKMISVFFDDTVEKKKKFPRGGVPIHLVQDTISKDLGIPLCKIGREEVGLWEQKGFKKHKLEDWMTFSEEDKKRYMKMLRGGYFRK